MLSRLKSQHGHQRPPTATNGHQGLGAMCSGQAHGLQDHAAIPTSTIKMEQLFCNFEFFWVCRLGLQRIGGPSVRMACSTPFLASARLKTWAVNPGLSLTIWSRSLWKEFGVILWFWEFLTWLKPLKLSGTELMKPDMMVRL